MKPWKILGIIVGCISLSYASPLTTRIKDIVSVEGVRENLLIGYGLVVGLSGSGDSLSSSPFTRESLVSMLERLGVNTRDKMAQMNTKNVAAVMVTANLPPFARQGSRIDVNISAMGDAKNLTGGNLLVTPMLAADGEVYAVAQGSLVVPGILAQGRQASVQRNVTTVARVPQGAIVEKEAAFALNSKHIIKLALRQADFTTAQRIASVINKHTQKNLAQPLDPSTVQVHIPSGKNAFDFLARIENLKIVPDCQAKVVLNPNSGTVIINQNVVISPVAISHGNLTIQIKESTQASQPQPWARRGKTKTLEDTQIHIREASANIAMFKGTTLQDIVKGLHALGLPVHDMIAIFQALKSAGALQAELEVQS